MEKYVGADKRHNYQVKDRQEYSNQVKIHNKNVNIHSYKAWYH